VIWRFGNFELKDGELRRNGSFVKLPPQPMGVLELLLEHAGELVTREQIQRRAWGEQTFVDFDRNLNVCMAQIRSALNDDADSPRFIRTMPKRGYMFLVPVERDTPPPATTQPKSNIAAAVVFGLVALASVAGAWAVLHKPADQNPPHRLMVAVLPFDGDDNLATGVLDELISNLGTLQTSRLGVIARTSVLHYRKSQTDLKQLARDLNVQYVVEGTLRSDAGRIRVTARLIDLSDQSLAWTDVYEGDVENQFQLEQNVSARITAGVAHRLFPQIVVPSRQEHAINREAFEAYRTGRSLQTQGTRAAVQRSLDSFETAIRLDPRYTEAYAALADACVSIARSGGSSKEMLTRAATAASKALDLDDSSAEAHLALANVRFWNDWNWSAAEQQYTRALTINPSYAAAHHDYAWFLVAMGRAEQSLIALRRAIALDPLSVRVNIDAGWLLQQAHRFQEAIVQAKRAQELDPGLEEAKACIARAEFYLGRNPSAPPGGRNPYSSAENLAATGQTNAALDALDQAFTERSLSMPLLNVDPAFTPLQTQPRFQRLIAKMKYP
jgi:TolB-like protein/DNA-binding winged helix-turn-helix (wHTH) protein